MPAKFELPFTQPSTIVAFLCTLAVVVFISPLGEIGRVDMLTTAVRLVHLFSFATWLGVQMWVTFFAGMYEIYFDPSLFYTNFRYHNVPTLAPSHVWIYPEQIISQVFPPGDHSLFFNDRYLSY